jgi:hypothetical protein
VTVHVGELTSEVTPEPEPGAAAGDVHLIREAILPWAEVDRHRALRCWLAENAARTRAEGFDD